MAVTTTLSIEVLAGGTIGITAEFQDGNGDAVTPNTLTYTLLDEYEEVINSLQDQSLTPDTSVTVTLSGDDLPAGTHYFIIEGTYDSDLGNDLPLKGYATFTVTRLPGE